MTFRARWTTLTFLIGAGACAQGSSESDPSGPPDDDVRAIASDSGNGSASTHDGSSSVDRNEPPESDAGATDAAVSPTSAKRVFITSVKYNGNLGGGATGADSKCAKSAAIALLGGTWKAWISDSTHDAVDRIANVGPWYTVDGKTKMFDDIFDLIAPPSANIDKWLDELGNSPTGQLSVWTGTENGKRAYGTCDDWSSNSGSGECYYFTYQSYSSNYGCNTPFSLLCVEQ